MAYLEARYLPDLSRHIVTERDDRPAHFRDTLNSHLGSAFSVEPILTQSAWFRPHNRSEDIANLYFAGAGTHPGAGLPGVLSSGKIVAEMIGAGASRPGRRRPRARRSPRGALSQPCKPLRRGVSFHTVSRATTRAAPPRGAARPDPGFLDHMDIQITTKKSEGVERLLEVSVPLVAVRDEEEKTARKYAASVRLPGFRPGKAPAAMVRKRFKDAIRQQVIETLVQEAFKEVMEREKLDVAAQPHVHDVKFEDGQPLTFELHLEVRPKIELDAHRGLHGGARLRRR